MKIKKELIKTCIHQIPPWKIIRVWVEAKHSCWQICGGTVVLAHFRSISRLAIPLAELSASCSLHPVYWSLRLWLLFQDSLSWLWHSMFQISPEVPEASQNQSVVLRDGRRKVVGFSKSQDAKIWKHSSEKWTSIISFLGHISSWRYIQCAPSQLSGRQTAVTPMPGSLCTGKWSFLADSFLGKRLVLVRHTLLKMSAVQDYESQMSSGKGTMAISWSPALGEKFLHY